MEGILSGAHQECQIRRVERDGFDEGPPVATLLSHQIAETLLRSINSRQVAHISPCLACGPPPFLLVPMPTGTSTVHHDEQAEEQPEESERTHDEEIEDFDNEVEDSGRTNIDEPESEHSPSPSR